MRFWDEYDMIEGFMEMKEGGFVGWLLGIDDGTFFVGGNNIPPAA
jgi:hypothetical protein